MRAHLRLGAGIVISLLFALPVCAESIVADPSDEYLATTVWSVFVHTDDGEDTRRTRIWIAELEDALYIRTGSTRWHQDVLLDPHVTIESGENRQAFLAVAVLDPAEHERVMQAYREKYGWMDWVIYRTRGTTFRLDPILDDTKPVEATLDK